jgi:hypothetical protein
MGMDDIKNKAKDMMGQHSDQVENGIDKARDFADEKTGKKYSDQLGNAADKAKQAVGRTSGNGDNNGGRQN